MKISFVYGCDSRLACKYIWTGIDAKNMPDLYKIDFLPRLCVNSIHFIDVYTFFFSF